MQTTETLIRRLELHDTPHIVTAFQQLGWTKPATQYEHYLVQQELGARDVYVGFIEGKFAGYLTICWSSSYEPFRSEGIPEIMDFNVLPEFRRRGVGTQLMDRAESEIARISLFAGIGVGMIPDYGAAQRLYVRRGYVPDGHGLHYKGYRVRYGDEITVDDSLALYLTKELDG